jgi:hypothetical protein
VPHLNAQTLLDHVVKVMRTLQDAGGAPHVCRAAGPDCLLIVYRCTRTRRRGGALRVNSGRVLLVHRVPVQLSAKGDAVSGPAPQLPQLCTAVTAGKGTPPVHYDGNGDAVSS